MELYLDLISPPCRSVYLFATAVGIPFEFKLVELLEGKQYSEEFGKLNIVRKIPVLKDGSFILTESTAILMYLVQKCSSAVADHWFPANLQQRARVNEYLSWQHLNLRTHCAKVFLLKTLYPFAMGSEVPKEKMDAALDDMKQSLDLLEEKFLLDKPFILGDNISLADLVAVVELMQPLGSGVNSLESRPRLMAWKERVKKKLGEELFDQAHQKLLEAKGLQQEIQNSPHLQKLQPVFVKLFR
ncbi:glutathione S-transferase theta-1a [Nothobranchius furzeri]|uniref:glutathione transferase n=2 Tax=Nothobranchius furzeri TaxID=105023 RepID=A0A8C6M2S1_NOTFU|nr:glutathione S-transferase theta-1-like [Nothobranchius furzeri]